MSDFILFPLSFLNNNTLNLLVENLDKLSLPSCFRTVWLEVSCRYTFKMGGSLNIFNKKYILTQIVKLLSVLTWSMQVILFHLSFSELHYRFAWFWYFIWGRNYAIFINLYNFIPNYKCISSLIMEALTCPPTHKSTHFYNIKLHFFIAMTFF